MPTRDATATADPMTRDEMLRLFDSGDLHGLMLATIRAAMGKYHPDVNLVTLVGERGKGMASVQLPIPRPTLASSSA